MRTIVLILALSFVTVAIPLAAADEGHPDCEAGQPLIGYRSTLFLRDILNNMGRPAYVCEGEHWDGQDTVQPDQTAACPGPSANLNPNDFFVGTCGGPDINTPPSLDPLNPLTVRVSSANGNEAYTGLNIAGVGRAALFVSKDHAAIYLRDNTPGNLLATVISQLRITQGYPAESDCSQDIYHNGAMNPPSACGRDNTAITVEHGLIP